MNVLNTNYYRIKLTLCSSTCSSGSSPSACAFFLEDEAELSNEALQTQASQN